MFPFNFCREDGKTESSGEVSVYNILTALPSYRLLLMRWLLFLSRLAFICGVCSLLSFLLLIMKGNADHAFESTIITIGFVMGLIVVPGTLICYLGVLIARKKLREIVPFWLIMANIFFFLFLIYFIFYLNDPYYHQG